MTVDGKPDVVGLEMFDLSVFRVVMPRARDC